MIAGCGWAFAPWRIVLFGLQISSDAPFKPLTLGLVALVAWVGVSSRMRAAYARRSAFAFYALTTAFLFVCSLGPRPTAFGHQFLYEPPYAWLMRLPLFRGRSCTGTVRHAGDAHAGGEWCALVESAVVRNANVSNGASSRNSWDRR